MKNRRISMITRSLVNDIRRSVSVAVVSKIAVRINSSVGGRVGRKGGVSCMVVSVEVALRQRCESGVRARLESSGDRGRRWRGREVCDSAWYCDYRARRRCLGRTVASGSKLSVEMRLRSKGKAAAVALQAGAMLSAKSRAAKWRVLARTWSLLPSSMQASMRPLMRASLRAEGLWRQVAVAEERNSSIFKCLGL